MGFDLACVRSKLDRKFLNVSRAVGGFDSRSCRRIVRGMNVEVPDATAAAAKLTPDEARLWLAFSLYREGRLSTGPCAELAGLDRRAFMDELARHRVEAPYAVSDWEADVATLQKLGHL